jgi:tetratricopeptide (TPR) repeat protein
MPTIKKRGSAAKKQQPEQEIRSLLHKAAEFAGVHRKNLIIIAAVLAAVLIIFSGYRYTRSMQEEKAAPLLASAYVFYAPSEGTAPDYIKALDLFRDVRNKYPAALSGAIAQYYAGNCLANLGRNDEALKEYQDFAAKYSGDKFLLGLVYERMGYVDIALGGQADAIKAFERSESLIGPGASSVELARLYEAAGNIAASQNKYKQVADKLAGTPWAMEAMSKIQKIAPLPMPASGKEGK